MAPGPPSTAARLSSDGGWAAADSERRRGRAGGLRFAQDVSEGDSSSDDDIDERAPATPEIAPWRMRERMKTMDVALMLCLNIGTDPPDVVKSSPCARKECWVDPFSMPAQKAIETIGKTLQSQYERWQPRARYRQSLDPTVEETKQLCVSMRRLAKHDRVLFHYNGHGVPRPTQNGEIWVFNKSYTQYIPLLVYDLQSWVGTPSIYVFDCSAAGVLLSHFNSSSAPPPSSTHGGGGGGASSAPPNGSALTQESIVLAACGANDLLPMNPELCADVFTSCLTTPITVALRWFISQNDLSMAHVDPSFIDRIPGKLTDRKTLLGELNWIFTAVTDTIAWNMLPRELFQKLFRQDLLVASLFRNFLLAERIMKSEGCAPCSLPALPPTNHHPLWRSWDLAAEVCLNQLFKFANPHPNTNPSFQPSRFFAEQLTAFEVWLQFGSASKPPPQQLPMVLQVLLSQVHRLRALVLLKKFLDLGPWAVNLALSVGIFPYVLKLLQSPASELRQVLVFIWTKILALDATCQVDLVKDDGHSYFVSHLASSLQTSRGSGDGHGASLYGSSTPAPPTPHGPISSQQKVMAAFVLSVICNNYQPGQRGCLAQYLHKICCGLLGDRDDEVRKWMCLCLAKLWENFDDAKRIAIDDNVPQLLYVLLQDDYPEVRAAAVYALGTLVGFQVDPTGGDAVEWSMMDEFCEQRAHDDILLATELIRGCRDGSPLVRRESVLALANVIVHSYHLPRFEAVARHFKGPFAARKRTISQPLPSTAKHASEGFADGYGLVENEEAVSVENDEAVGLDISGDDDLEELIGEDATYYVQIWEVLKEVQARDPLPKVVNTVKTVVGYVNARVLEAEKMDRLRAAEQQQSTATNAKRGGPAEFTGEEGRGSSHHMQRENSVPDLPAYSSFASGHSERDDAVAANRSSSSTVRDPRLSNRDATLSAHSGGGGGAPSRGIRPTHSVGNFRQYQDLNRNDHTGMQYNRSGGYETMHNLPAAQGSSNHQRGSEQGYGELHPQAAMARLAASRGGYSGGQMIGGLRPGDHGEQYYGHAPPMQQPPPSVQRHGRQDDFPLALVSVLYERHKAHFNEAILDPVYDDDDPLSERGAEKWDRARRYERIRQSAHKLAPGFLIPSSSGGEYPQSVQTDSRLSGGAGFEDPVGSYPLPGFDPLYPVPAGPPLPTDRDDVKNFSLNLRQRAVINNDAEMTSLLLFHPYESMLVVADDKDQLAVYQVDETEKKLLSFGNKNPPGYVLYRWLCRWVSGRFD